MKQKITNGSYLDIKEKYSAKGTEKYLQMVDIWEQKKIYLEKIVYLLDTIWKLYSYDGCDDIINIYKW